MSIISISEYAPTNKIYFTVKQSNKNKIEVIPTDQAKKQKKDCILKFIESIEIPKEFQEEPYFYL